MIKYRRKDKGIIMTIISSLYSKKCYGDLNYSLEKEKNYREFFSEKETKEWGEKYYKLWSSQYKKTMRLAKEYIKTSLGSCPIECYCGYTYREIGRT